MHETRVSFKLDFKTDNVIFQAFDNASSKMSRAKRTNWGVAMCTVDGQRYVR